MMEGFESLTEAADVAGSSLVSDRWTIQSSNTRFGTDYSRWSGGVGFKSTLYDGYVRSRFPLPNPFTVGWAMWRPVGSASYHASRNTFMAYDGASQQNGSLGSVGAEVFVEQPNSLGHTFSTTGLILGGVWQYWEVKFYSHASAGYCEIRINGVEAINVTGKNFMNAVDIAISFRIGLCYDLSPTYIDDVYVTDGEFLGPVKVKTFKPDSDGTYTDFAPSAGSNYENVDEIPYDGDTSYNQGNAIGDKDTVQYTVGALGGPVKAVQLASVRKKSSIATARVKNLIRSNSTDYLSSSEVNMQTDYVEDVEVYEDDPDDSNPWTQTKIEAAEFGLQITSLSTTTTTTTT